MRLCLMSSLFTKGFDMLKRIIYLVFFAVISVSCGRVVQPATIVDTSVKSYSPEEREYLVEAYREAYLNEINEKAKLKAFVFPLLKEATQIARAIPEEEVWYLKEVSKKSRSYGFREDYGLYVIGSHLIDDYSQESLDAWKAIGVSPEDDFETVFQVYKGSVAKRAGLKAGDRIPPHQVLFVNHQGEIYLRSRAANGRKLYLKAKVHDKK